jgi:hypothetical protein
MTREEDYPTCCPACKVAIPLPKGMNLYQSMKTGQLVCYKCAVRDEIYENNREIRRLERENRDLEEELIN